jgi:hypothetical protein
LFDRLDGKAILHSPDALGLTCRVEDYAGVRFTDVVFVSITTPP